MENEMERVLYYVGLKGNIPDRGDPTPRMYKKMLSGEAHFDSRAIQPNGDADIYKIFRWRQLDAFRNGVSSLAREYITHKESTNMNTGQKIAVIKSHNVSMDNIANCEAIHGVWFKTRQSDELIESNKPSRGKQTEVTKDLLLDYPRDFVTLPTPSVEWMMAKYAYDYRTHI